MKRLIQILIVPLVASFAIIGCGDKGNNNRVDPFNNGNFPPGFPFQNGNFGTDSFRGVVSFQGANGKDIYRQYLEESANCSRLPFGIANTCNYIDRAPFVAIAFESREYLQGYGLPATVIVEPLPDGNSSWGFTPVGRNQNRTNFYYINNSSQLEADVYTYTGNLRISLVGAPTDNQITVQLSYRGQVFGQASLSRIGFGGAYDPRYGNPGFQNGYDPRWGRGIDPRWQW